MVLHPDQEYVLRTIKSRDVHFVRFWFTDVLGNMKSFAVSPNELQSAFEEGIGFDGSCIDGFAGVEEADMLAFPDASTFQILPWRPQTESVARMFCKIQTPSGNRAKGDSRHILAKVVDQARAMGYEPNLGPEVEFFYFKDHHSPTPLDQGGYFDLTTLDSASDLRRDTVLTLEQMGIPIEYSHHENGPSQHEIDLRFSDAMQMADAVMTYKMVVKEVAAKHGVYASFMPKPLPDAPGNGMHVHHSLFNEDGTNVFWDPEDPSGDHLSDIAKHYIAGLLHYAPEYSLLTNQYVNSYKRLISGGEAPFYISWGHRNRTTLVRVPGYKPNKEVACRVELRSPDPACNPYLAFAGTLAAGLQGIKDKLELSSARESRDLGQMSRWELKEAGFETLPESLGEAIERFEGSKLMKEVLGEHVHSYLVRAKRKEWAEYERSVSQWELSRYLGVL